MLYPAELRDPSGKSLSFLWPIWEGRGWERKGPAFAAGPLKVTSEEECYAASSAGASSSVFSVEVARLAFLVR